MTVTKTAAAHEDPAGDPARRAALISAPAEIFLEHGTFPDRGQPKSGPMDVAVAERMRELRLS